MAFASDSNQIFAYTGPTPPGNKDGLRFAIRDHDGKITEIVLPAKSVNELKSALSPYPQGV